MGKRVGRCAGRTGNFRGHSQKFDGRSRNFRGGREYGFRQEYRRTLDRSTREQETFLDKSTGGLFGQEYKRTGELLTGGQENRRRLRIAIGCVNGNSEKTLGFRRRVWLF